VLNFLFNHKYQIRPAFYLDPAGLRRRFILCGVVHAIFLPFVLFFLTLHFGFQNAYDWKSTKKYLGPREWSLHARWLFREFNELPHSFERRLAPSYQATEEYLKLFGSSGTTAALGRVLVFMSGSVGAVLFLFAAINDAILLHVKIADWNLLWYAGVVGVVYSVGKSMVPSDESSLHPRSIRNLLAETDAALQNVATHTHYYLESWKGRGADPATLATITSMFKFKANLFAMEVLAVVVAPYILCVSLAQSSEPICEFVVAVKEEIVGAGEVCGFATFDFDKYADEAWEGKTMGPTAAVRESGPDHHPTLAESIAYTGNVERAAEQLRKPKTRHGKMEKSFFSFMVRVLHSKMMCSLPLSAAHSTFLGNFLQASHPSWQCSASGQSLVDRVAQYERDETHAFSREQQLHIDAAARQLETLARWEQQRRTPDAFNVRGLDESYIPKSAQAPADAGAGLYPEAASTYHPPPYQRQRSPYLEESYDGASPQRSPLSRTSDSISVAPPSDDPILPFASASADGSPRALAPPPPAAASLSRSLAPSLGAATGFFGAPPMAATTLAASPTSPGLSSELRRILNLSSLDPDVRSVVLGRSALMLGGAGGATGIGTSDFDVGAGGAAAAASSALFSSSSNDVEDRRMERQYMWLERYHAHVAAQQGSGAAEQGGAAASSHATASSAFAGVAHTDVAAGGRPRQRHQPSPPPPPPPNRIAPYEEDADGSSHGPFGSIV
jgi:Autophagy protein ATG9